MQKAMDLPDAFQGYDFGGKWIEPRLARISTTCADVIVNSIGIKAGFGSAIANDILQVAGQKIKDSDQKYHAPLTPGNVVITHAGNLTKLCGTHYIFHSVITNRESAYRANSKLIKRVVTRSIQIADLLDQTSIAIPALGSGKGRADPAQVVKDILSKVIELLPECTSIKKVIFATTSPEIFDLFNRRALADLALAQREQELKNALRDIPLSLYGLVGDLLQKMETARQGGDAQEAVQLQDTARGLISLGQKLKDKLPAESLHASAVVQMIIATGGSIVHSISQQAET